MPIAANCIFSRISNSGPSSLRSELTPATPSMPDTWLSTPSNSCGSLRVTKYDSGNALGPSVSSCFWPVSDWPSSSRACS